MSDNPVIAAAVLLAIGLAPQARDPRPAPATGTAVIAGRVVAVDESATPVRRARVTVTSSTMEVTRAVIAADDGSFVVAGLPVGRYTVSASKPGWIRGSAGAVKPGRSGVAIALAAAQRVNDVLVRMAKGGVVTGTVTDENGRPLPGVAVRLMQYRIQEGVRLLSPIAAADGDLTDDRGEYRMFGLSAGEYAVAAIPPDAGGPPTRSPSGGTVAYVPVYYPGTTVAADARTISVPSGGEIAGVNVRMQFVRTARIEGSITGGDAIAPQDIQITLTPLTPAPPFPGEGGAAALSTSLRLIASPRPDRTFSYAGVAPGRYTLAARVVERPPPTAGASYASLIRGVTTMWAMAEIAVDGSDLPGVTLALQPPLTITGRVRLERTAAPAGAPPIDLTRVRVFLTPAAARPDVLAMAIAPATNARANGEFVLGGVVPGRYRLNAAMDGNVANGWWLKSSMHRERDTVDFPIEIPPGEHLNGVELTLTDTTQRVSGTLLDSSNQPAPHFTIVLFPADRAYWAVARRIRTAKPGQDGRYTISDLPFGDYRVAAVSDIEPGDQYDPAFLEQLVAASVAVTVRPGERKIQDLRIK
jgi:hypothetical protein